MPFLKGGGTCCEKCSPRKSAFVTVKHSFVISCLVKRAKCVCSSPFYFPSIPKSWQKSIILRALDLAAGRFKPDRASCMLEPSGVDRRARGRAGRASRVSSPNCPPSESSARSRPPQPPARVTMPESSVRARAPARPALPARPCSRPGRSPSLPAARPRSLRWFRHLSGAVRSRRGPLVVQWPAVSATFNLTGGTP